MPSANTPRSQRARIAALARIAKEPSGAAMTEQARTTFRDSFYVGHECDLCPRIEIDQALPAAEITRMGDAAYRLHMSRMSHRAALARAREAGNEAVAEKYEAELAAAGEQV